jgi:hypothetical protein
MTTLAYCPNHLAYFWGDRDKFGSMKRSAIELVANQNRGRVGMASVSRLSALISNLRPRLAFVTLCLVLGLSTGCTSARTTEQNGFKLIFDMRYSDMKKLIDESDVSPLTQAQLETQIQMDSTKNCIPSNAKLSNSFTYVGWNAYPPDQPMTEEILNQLSCYKIGRSEEGSTRVPLMVFFQNPISNRAHVNIKTWGSQSEWIQDPILKKHAMEVQRAFPNDLDRCQIVTKEIVEKGVNKTLFVGLVTYPDTVAWPSNDRLEAQITCYNLPLFLSAGVSTTSLQTVVRETKSRLFINTSSRLLALVRSKILDAPPEVPRPSQ